MVFSGRGPYDRVCFFSRFDFCTSGSASPVENLGQILLGDRIRPSPYEVLALGQNEEQFNHFIE